MGNTVNNITNIYGAAAPLVGEVKMWLGATEPDGWKLLNGQAISRTGFADAFTLLGETHGAGDGSTTFNLPDLRDRTILGASATHTVGSYSGANAVTLTRAQIPGTPVHSTNTGGTAVTSGVNYLGGAPGGPSSAGIWSTTEPAAPNRAFVNGPEVPTAVDTTPANLAVNFLIFVGP